MKKCQIKTLVKCVIGEMVEMALNEAFDLKGNNSGVKFGITAFEWRTLVELIIQVNRTFNLGIKGLGKWHYNTGEGLKTQEECNKLANALETLIRGQPYNKVIKMKKVPEFAARLTKYYKIQVSMIIKFIEFLKKCDGFEIR